MWDSNSNFFFNGGNLIENTVVFSKYALKRWIFSPFIYFFSFGLKFLCLIIINFLVLFCVFSYRNFSGFVNVQKTNQTVFPFKLGILKFKYNLFNNNSNNRKWYHQRVFQNCLLCHKYRDQKQSLGVFFFWDWISIFY